VGEYVDVGGLETWYDAAGEGDPPPTMMPFSHAAS
jgi:hypothetical protein